MIEATVAMAAMAGLFVVFGAFRIADRGHGCDACGSPGSGCGACDMDGACDMGGACEVVGARELDDSGCTPGYHSKGSPS